ncbi:MAG: LptF/LptG family permease [Campylobacterales bacterium]
MKRVESYILRNFLAFFWPLFFTLFAISSLVLIIRLADLTGVVSVNFLEFISLYLFGVPQLLFYTLPIAFFLSAGLVYAKLSFDRELVAIFALGANLKDVLRPIIKISILFSLTLFFMGYFVHPYSTAVAKNFVESKKSLSRLNVKPSEAGQKFGDWLVFISGEKDGEFADAVLFSASSKASLVGEGGNDKNQSATFVSAKSAKIVSDGGVSTFVLSDGKGYRLEEQNGSKLIYFKEMGIRSQPQKADFEPSNFIGYWAQMKEDKKRAKDFSDVFLTSVFPIASIFFIPAFGILNPRYQKNRSAFFFIISAAVFYAFMLTVNPILTYFGILVVTPIWFLLGYFLYKKSGAVRF